MTPAELEVMDELGTIFDEAPVGLPLERYQEIVLKLIAHLASEGPSDDEIAQWMGMSIVEVWSVRKELLACCERGGLDS